MTQTISDKELAVMVATKGDWDTEVADEVALNLRDARAELAALRAKLEALRLVDTLARNSTDMTKIREAEKAAYACGAIEEER